MIPKAMDKMRKLLRIVLMANELGPALRSALVVGLTSTLADLDKAPLSIKNDEAEIQILTPAGELMCIPTYEASPEGLDYLCFKDSDTLEEIYRLTKDEIVEDPLFVLGCIFGGFIHGTKQVIDEDEDEVIH